MKTTLHGRLAIILVTAGLATAGPVAADKPDWAGNGKSNQSTREYRQQDRRDGSPDQGRRRDDGRKDVRSDERRGSKVNEYFNDHQRVVVRDYYHDRYRAGRCPPGLAKKQNGCMPPGQARKWRVGRPLPHDVVYYDLPSSVVVSLGVPPSGHKYVRVAADILLIAVGTGMVVDAINDLGR